MSDVKISIQDWLNKRPEIKSGKVELLAAFEAHMILKKVTVGTTDFFKQALETFRKTKV